MCMAEKAHCRMKSRVWANSSSVSPGKPTIRSVVMAGPGFWKCFRSRSTLSRYRAVPYFRFIRFSVASQPLWRDRWKWGHRLGRPAARTQKSSVMVRGSREPSRTRQSGAAAHTDSMRSMRVSPVRRSRPQEEISIPVSTISR